MILSPSQAVEATAKAETEAGDAPTKRLKTSAGTKIANAGGASTETLRLPACGIERRPKRKHEDEVNEGDGTEDDGVNKDDGKEGGGGNVLPSTWSREEGEPPRKRIRVGVPGKSGRPAIVTEGLGDAVLCRSCRQLGCGLCEVQNKIALVL